VALVEQIQALNLFEQNLVHDRALDRASAEAALDQLFARIAENGGAVRVAVWNGAVVGHIFLAFDRLPPYIREDLRPIAYVADLFVRAALRGQGIGTALLEEAETIASAAGLKRMVLGVVHGNHDAERAYRRQGYRDYVLEMVKDIGKA